MVRCLPGLSAILLAAPYFVSTRILWAPTGGVNQPDVLDRLPRTRRNVEIPCFMGVGCFARDAAGTGTKVSYAANRIHSCALLMNHHPGKRKQTVSE
jgi:hypothetical protein